MKRITSIIGGIALVTTLGYAFMNSENNEPMPVTPKPVIQTIEEKVEMKYYDPDEIVLTPEKQEAFEKKMAEFYAKQNKAEKEVRLKRLKEEESYKFVPPKNPELEEFLSDMYKKNGITNQRLIENGIPVYDDLLEDKIEVPNYDIASFHCSEYVRRAGKQLYNKNYSWSHAWDRMYNDKCITSLENIQDLKELDENGILQPGMVIALYNEKKRPYRSRGRIVKDKKGLPVKATHVVLYCNKENDEYIVVNQRGNKQEKNSIQRLEELGFSLQYLIDEK